MGKFIRQHCLRKILLFCNSPKSYHLRPPLWARPAARPRTPPLRVLILALGAFSCFSLAQSCFRKLLLLLRRYCYCRHYRTKCPGRCSLDLANLRRFLPRKPQYRLQRSSLRDQWDHPTIFLMHLRSCELLLQVDTNTFRHCLVGRGPLDRFRLLQMNSYRR